MSIPKIGSGNLTQQKVEETAPQQAPGAESGFSGSSSFSNKDVQLKATSSALLGVNLGGLTQSALGDVGGSTFSRFFNDSTSAPSNSELGPLGDLFKGDNTFSTMVKNSFNKTTNSVGNKMIDAIKEGVGEGGGKGLGKMSKETEKKFWDIYFMKNILNGSKEAWKAQEKAMKKALKDAGVNVPDDSNSHVDLPSMWDLWAMSEGKKIDAPPYLVKTMLGGQKATEAEKKEYEAMMKA